MGLAVPGTMLLTWLVTVSGAHRRSPWQVLHASVLELVEAAVFPAALAGSSDATAARANDVAAATARALRALTLTFAVVGVAAVVVVVALLSCSHLEKTPALRAR